MLKSKLESEGVVCYLFDEHTAAMNPTHNLFTGGIKLKINEFDTEKVKLILQEIGQQSGENESQKLRSCLRCKSAEVNNFYKPMKGFKGLINAIVCLVFPSYYKSLYKCSGCNLEFKLDD